MLTFIIIDSLGIRRGTVKAATAFEATKTYIGDKGQAEKGAYTNVFAIAEIDLKAFQSNVKKLK